MTFKLLKWVKNQLAMFHMKGSLPFKRTIKQTAGTMPLTPKTVATAKRAAIVLELIIIKMHYISVRFSTLASRGWLTKKWQVMLRQDGTEHQKSCWTGCTITKQVCSLKLIKLQNNNTVNYLQCMILQALQCVSSKKSVPSRCMGQVDFLTGQVQSTLIIADMPGT